MPLILLLQSDEGSCSINSENGPIEENSSNKSKKEGKDLLGKFIVIIVLKQTKVLLKTYLQELWGFMLHANVLLLYRAPIIST